MKCPHFFPTLVIFISLHFAILSGAQVPISGSPVLAVVQDESQYYIYPESYSPYTGDKWDMIDGRYIKTQKKVEHFYNSGSWVSKVSYLTLPDEYAELLTKPSYMIMDETHYSIYDARDRLIYSNTRDTVITRLQSILVGSIGISGLNPVSRKYFPNCQAIQNLVSIGYTVISQTVNSVKLQNNNNFIFFDFSGLIKTEYEQDISGKKLYEKIEFYSSVGTDSMTLAYQAFRTPIVLRSGQCAEKVSATKYLSKTFGSRTIVLDEFKGIEPRDAEDLVTKPDSLIMADEFVIYPNPAADILYINKPKGINKIEIFNQSGNPVLRINCQSQPDFLEVNTSKLAPGAYHIRMSGDSNESLQSKSFIKN